MRVFTASLATETNTFAPMPTALASFQIDGTYWPAGTHPAQMTIFAGPLQAARQRARQHGWTLVEGRVATAQPSSTTTHLAHAPLRAQILAHLQPATPVPLAPPSPPPPAAGPPRGCRRGRSRSTGAKGVRKGRARPGSRGVPTSQSPRRPGGTVF